MKRLLILLICFLNVDTAFACSDVFVNRPNYHVQARTLDFPLNVSVNNNAGFLGQKNTTDVVLDADKIPEDQLTSWTNKYGYFGRTAFDTPKMIDGMNTEGFSIAMLYLPGTKYPIYNPEDSKPVIASYDLGAYLLAMASNVDEALSLIDQHQIVQAAIEAKPGIFLKDLPIHYALRDKSGKSAIVEFIDGKTTVYPDAGNVMTNRPPYDWQRKHAAEYDSLNPKGPVPNPEFSKSVLDYDYIVDVSGNEAPYLLGLPGDYTSPSRFVRGTVLLNNLNEPHSSTEAVYQAQAVLNALIVPPVSDSFTLWSIVKDLDNNHVYIHDLGFFQGGKRFFPMSITNGYILYDLNAIDFNTVPTEYEDTTIQPTPASDIKKMLSSEDVPGF